MKFDKRSALTSLWIASVFISTQNIATAADVARDHVIAMLSAHDTVASVEEWRSLGDSAVPILIDIAQDLQQPTARRMRALIALGSFSGDPAIETFKAFAIGADTSPTLKRTAILALAEASPEKALPVVDDALASDDPLLRQTAVMALAKIPGTQAKQLLETQRARETVPFLTEQIDKALADEAEQTP